MSKELKGSLLLLMCAVIWGTAFAAQSDGMNYVEPFTYNAARTLVGGIVLVPVCTAARHVRRKRGETETAPLKSTVHGGICCGFFLFLASSFQQAGISMTTAGKAGFITALYIIIVPFIGLFTGKVPTMRIWLCAALAVFGFYLLCMGTGMSISRGDMLVLVCAFFFSLHIIVIDKFNGMNTDPVLMSCIQFFTAGALMLICMFIFEDPHMDSVLDAWLPVLYAGVMSSGVAYTLQIAGQKHTPPAAASLIMSLEAVFAALSGWMILGERLSLRELCGCVVVFVAVAAAQLSGTSDVSSE